MKNCKKPLILIPALMLMLTGLAMASDTGTPSWDEGAGTLTVPLILFGSYNPVPGNVLTQQESGLFQIQSYQYTQSTNHPGMYNPQNAGLVIPLVRIGTSTNNFVFDVTMQETPANSGLFEFLKYRQKPGGPWVYSEL